MTVTSQADQIRGAWDAIAEGFDRHTTPHTMALGEHALARMDLRPGVRVLDVGAGSGGLSIPAARTGAQVVALDIAPAMIEHLTARARAEQLPSLEGRVGDGEELEFDDATFDVAVSMNGVTLFPDIARGLGEMCRVTRPGGTVLVITFGPLQEVEFVAFPLAAMRAAVPDLPPPPDPLPPFRLAGVGALHRTLENADLREVRVETVRWETPFDSADHLLATVLTSNPIATQLSASMTEEQFAQARQVLDGMVRERSGGNAGAVLHSQMQIGWGAVS